MDHVARLPLRRQRRFDAVFYVPAIGAILASKGSLPPGGAETQMLMLSRQLAGRGHRVAIIVFDQPGGVPSEIDGVAIISRPPFKKQRLVGKFLESWAIWSALWRAPSSVVVKRGVGVEVALIGLYTKLSGRRLVFSSANVVDFDAEQVMPKRRDQRLYEWGMRWVDSVVVQTQEQVPMCTSRLRREPVLIKSLSSAGHGEAVEPEAFLWVGRLVSYKRPMDYIELARALPEAEFWMVGVPTVHLESDREVAEAAIEAARKLPNLQLLDPRPRSEVQELMARAVASVNTADFEGMPNVLLEAWALGVPALVLRHDPDGVVSRLGLGGFANGSSEKFVQLARDLWGTRFDRSELSERCRTYVAENHSPNVVTRQWEQVLGVDAIPLDADDHDLKPTVSGTASP